MLGNMAGNAYSMFHYLPWNIATLCTFARFRGDSSPQYAEQSADGVQEVDTSSSGERSDSD